jgi:hypothetical protein
MEWFGPLPGAPVAECESKARDCDVLLSIVPHRYGFEPGRGSITRREVEAPPGFEPGMGGLQILTRIEAVVSYVESIQTATVIASIGGLPMCNRRWRALVLCGAVISVSAAPSQGPEVKNVMREKLRLAQSILEAVVISDWASLEANSQDLARLTSDPRWRTLKYPEYAKQSTAFVRAVEALHAAAVERDLNKTPKAYTGVTLQCVECHRYLARQRIAH